MKQLFSIDLKDYKANDFVFRRPSARAIIMKDNRIALVYSIKKKIVIGEMDYGNKKEKKTTKTQAKTQTKTQAEYKTKR